MQTILQQDVTENKIIQVLPGGGWRGCSLIDGEAQLNIEAVVCFYIYDNGEICPVFRNGAKSFWEEDGEATDYFGLVAPGEAIPLRWRIEAFRRRFLNGK